METQRKLLSDILKALALSAGKDTTRPQLFKINVRADGATLRLETTNGHAACRYEFRGFITDPSVRVIEIPALKVVLAQLATEKGAIDLRLWFKSLPVAGESFPDLEPILRNALAPKTAPVTAIGVDPEYLAVASKQCDAVRKKSEGAVLKIGGALDPIVMLASKDGVECTCVVMPMTLPK